MDASDIPLLDGTATQREVWALQDFLKSRDANDMDDGWHARAQDFMRDHQVEVFSRPSRKPGVTGYPGASPEQLQYIQACHNPQFNILCACGANQSGKTSGLGVYLAEWIRDECPNETVVWIIAATSQTLRDIPCKTLWQFLPHSMFGDKIYNPHTGFGQTHTLVLDLPHGRGKAELWMWTEEMDLQVIESARIHRVWWTEVTREAIFDAIQPRLIKHSGKLLMDYVPREAWHRRRLRLASRIDPEMFWQHYKMKDNAHNLPEGTLERQKRRLTEAQYKMRVLGEEGLMEGLVYPQFSEERHVIEDFVIPEDWPRWRFLDYGFGMPTACGWATVAPVGWRENNAEICIIYREYYHKGRSIKDNASSVISISSKETYRRKLLVDPQSYARTASNEKTIAEQYEKHGIPCTPWPRTNLYGEEAMVERVRGYLESMQLFIFKSCVHGIGEFGTWQYKRNRDGQIDPNERFERGNNHLLDGIRGWLATNPRHTMPKMRIVDVPNIYA